MRSLPAARSAGPPSAPPPQGPGQYLLPLQVQHLLGEGRLRSLYLLQPLEKNRDRGHDGENKRQPGLPPRPSAQGTPPTWDVWLRGGPRHTPGWPLKRRFCVCTGVSAVTAVWVTDAHACVCSCGQRGRACPGEPACTGAVGACGVGACAGVRRTRASVEGRSCGRLGRRGWALSVTEVPCPAPGWWLNARDLIWPGHPVEWAAPPHLAGEDMQAELSHLLKVTQVGERGF